MIDETEIVGNSEGRELLLNFCNNGFAGGLGEAALVLGRDQDFISGALDGAEPVDEDLMIKIRGIAEERGIDLE